ncbi:globin-coupled sensor protein [Oricola cellulosilytica]|uniref:Globin-coupled sensor protein n=1 Tax=Oricola cellulosilytica TaxID=1429082 RepID=A0A4R0PCF6_9HYPH|nr:globin-coupled sensor protein [Oricola cellulosilytica]TCD14148.1 globin-coupled sensor protein [Oricola cellulosilytica]
MEQTPAKIKAAGEDIDGRLSFLGLDQKSRKKLSSLRPLIEKELPSALDKFYGLVKKTPETNRFFRDDEHMAGAKNAQLGHWAAIASGKFDEDYADRVRKIGKVHARVGLEPRWYIGGYGVIIEHLVKAAATSYWPKTGFFTKGNPGPEEFSEALSILLKAIMLDMDLSISVYIDEAEAARQRISEDALKAQKDIVESFGKAIRHLAEKDLTYRLADDMPEAYDGLRMDFNEALAALAETIRNIGDSAEQILSGSEEIRSAADDMARRAERQAASVEETAAAVEQITATVKSSSERAEESGKLVRRTRANAEQSGEVVRRAVEAMDRINKSSDEIAKIITVIDDIAFQTNLLALNAGVEAARAGEAGKGFAVVAQEVRELAQRSAGAAKEIKDLITSSGEEVKSGVSLVNETGEALESIVMEVSEIDQNVSSIVEAAREQSGGLAGINSSVSSIDEGTQQNAAMAEQLTASSHSLSDEVRTINEMLRQFVAGSQGSASPAAVAHVSGKGTDSASARDAA